MRGLVGKIVLGAVVLMVFLSGTVHVVDSVVGVFGVDGKMVLVFNYKIVVCECVYIL